MADHLVKFRSDYTSHFMMGKRKDDSNNSRKKKANKSKDDMARLFSSGAQMKVEAISAVFVN